MRPSYLASGAAVPVVSSTQLHHPPPMPASQPRPLRRSNYTGNEQPADNACEFAGSVCSGGGMNAYRSAWQVHRSTFVGNYARVKGAGIYSGENIHQALVQGCTMQRNVVDPYDVGEGGGGIYVWQVWERLDVLSTGSIADLG